MQFAVEGYGYKPDKEGKLWCCEEHNRAYVLGEKGNLYVCLCTDKEYKIYATDIGTVEIEKQSYKKLVRKGFLRFGFEDAKKWRYFINDKNEENSLYKYICQLRCSTEMSRSLEKLLEWKEEN